MVDGISNFQIEEAFKNINDDDINDNFVGSFPSNHMNKFVDPASMLFQKNGKYPFVVVNTDNSSKSGILARAGGVYFTLSQKQIFSFSIRLMLMA